MFLLLYQNNNDFIITYMASYKWTPCLCLLQFYLKANVFKIHSLIVC